MSVCKKSLCPDTVRLVKQLVTPLMERGLISCDEFDVLSKTLKNACRDKATETVAPRLLDAKTVAEMLGISYAEFRKLESEGAFPFKRRMLGTKTVRFYSRDVVAYMAETSDVSLITAGENGSSRNNKRAEAQKGQ